VLAWMNLVMSGMVCSRFRSIRSSNHVLVDRYLGGHFFDTQAGGSATLWMHFFWIFGHPSQPDHSMLCIRLRNYSGFHASQFSDIPSWWSTVCIAFVSMSVWRITCSPSDDSYANSFFTITTMAVGVPTGIKIFNWLARCGEARFSSRRRCCLHRLLIPVFDCRPHGIMLASSPFDWQLSLLLCCGALSLRDVGEFCSPYSVIYYWYPNHEDG